MPSMPAPDKPQPHPAYREVERVRDPDGVIAVISERIKTGQMTFALSKEYEQDGRTRTSSYLSRRHIDGIRRLLNDLEERLEGLEDRARSGHREKDAE